MPARARLPRADRPGRSRTGPTRRRSPLWVLVAIGAALLLTLLLTDRMDTANPRTAPPASSCGESPLQARELARLGLFTSWLKRNHAAGYVGEVGWPSGADAAAWNDVALGWYRAATAADLWITTWSASQWWPADYPMAAYRLPTSAAPGSLGSQTAVIDQFPGSRAAVRGIDVPTGAFGTADDGNSSYSNRNPGAYGADYSYESAAGYQYLAQHGVTTVRLSVTWERLQPEPGGALDPQGVARLIQAVNWASQAALDIIIDLHGFGGYWFGDSGTPTRLALGSPELPVWALADCWTRLVLDLKDVPGIIGYGLMNEPGRLAPDSQTGTAIWEDASQQAVTAIRATGTTTTLLISGYGGSSPEAFVELQPQAWITDPANNIRYEVHQYFDAARSGRYALTYAQEASVAGPVIRCPT